MKLKSNNTTNQSNQPIINQPPILSQRSSSPIITKPRSSIFNNAKNNDRIASPTIQRAGTPILDQQQGRTIINNRSTSSPLLSRKKLAENITNNNNILPPPRNIIQKPLIEVNKLNEDRVLTPQKKDLSPLDQQASLLGLPPRKKLLIESNSPRIPSPIIKQNKMNPQISKKPFVLSTPMRQRPTSSRGKISIPQEDLKL